MSLYKLRALYEQLKAGEKRHFCPRPGIYKVISTYKGQCYEKPAMMAKCHWRTTFADEYNTAFIRSIQLESFKINATEEQLKLLNSQELEGREIDVFAVELTGKGLVVSWKFVEQKTNLDELNKRLSSGTLGSFDLKQLDNFDLSDSEEFFEDV
ncbi:hypothetical protein [Pedobacter nanyangensis]|uniref:hypothetical protein n=1 Tax=Pedobacter nanyangensis TaxID=1562389 RepID=UPI000DE38D0C|nr:hypothetical protein [Pedobacter nanyangensis]